MLSTTGVESGFSSSGMIEEGEWNFRVAKAEVKTSKAGNFYTALTCECTDKAQAGRSVWHNLNWTEKTAQKSLGVLVALGIKADFDEEDQSDLQKLCKALLGKKFHGRVYHETSTYNGKERTNANFGSIVSLASQAPSFEDDDGDDLPF